MPRFSALQENWGAKVSGSLTTCTKYKNIRAVDFATPGEKLPSTVLHASFFGNEEYGITDLPASLLTLKVRGYFSHHALALPSTLRTLHLPSCHPYPLCRLPKSLAALEVANCYQETKFTFPSSLRTLCTMYPFMCPLPSLPVGLTSLDLEGASCPFRPSRLALPTYILVIRKTMNLYYFLLPYALCISAIISREKFRYCPQVSLSLIWENASIMPCPPFRPLYSTCG